MPLTLAGLAHYNIANIAGASLVAALLGVSPETIAATLTHFGGNRGDNPGRLQRWQINGIEVLLDYAHNPDGLAGLMAIGNGLRQQRGGRLGLLLGQAGNRDDGAICELAAVAAAAKPDFVVLKDLDGYLRGREQGEVLGAVAEEFGVPLHAQQVRCALDLDALHVTLGVPRDRAHAESELVEYLMVQRVHTDLGATDH